MDDPLQLSLKQRQDNTCAENFQYYACSKGHFSGCCSIDPCDDGVCPLENQQPGSPPSIASSPTTTTTSTSDMSGMETTVISVITSTFSSSLSFSTSFITSSAGNQEVVTTTIVFTNTYTSIATTPPTNNSPGNPSNHDAAIIGGCVGGVLGALLLFLIIFLCWRRKRKSSSEQQSNAEDVNKNRLPEFPGSSDFGPSELSGDFHGKYTALSPSLSELDSSPVPSFPRTARVLPSDPILELDSIDENTIGSPNFSSVSSRESHTFLPLGQPPWRTSQTNVSTSSDTTGGIRIAKSMENTSSTRSDTLLERDI